MLSFIRYFIFLFIATKIYSQVSVTSDLSSNYANSQNDYNYFENLMNINVASGNYMGWIELEFSNPPILGLDYKGIRKFRLDYIGDITQLKIGDLYEYWGNGMILNSVDDKSIDLDTGIRGALLTLSREQIDFSILAGNQKIMRSSNQILDYNERIPNYKSDYNLYGSRLNFIYNNFSGGIHFILANQFDKNINDVFKRNPHRLVGFNIDYFSEKLDLIFEYLSKDNNGSGLFADLTVHKEKLIFLKPASIGLTYKNYLFSFRSPNERWDFVNNKIGIIPIQQMPTAFQLHSAYLLSRITHVIDYNDEVGFNFNIKGKLFDNYEFLFSYSKSSRSDEWKLDDNYEWSKNKKNNSITLTPSNNDLFNPFKEVYLEIDGFNNNGKHYYKFGFSSMRDILELYENQKIISHDAITLNRYSYELRSAQTFPISYTYRLTDNHSVDFIFEYQSLKKGIVSNDDLQAKNLFSSNFSKPSQINRFINLGYSYSPKWSINFSVDYADTEEKIVLDGNRYNNLLEQLISNFFNNELTWANLEIAYNFKQNYRLSVSYGSKRGGVYCSNGICRYMQPFENGFAIKMISSF